MKRLAIVGFVMLLLAVPSLTEGTEDPPAKEHLMGDPLGLRRQLEGHGLRFSLMYTGEGFWNTRGGLNTKDAGEYRGDVSLFLECDTDEAGFWRNGMFFAHLQEQHGHGITNEHVGDFQVLSNIDADDFKQVSEFWYRHSFLDDQVWIKFGKMEANADFCFVDHGCEFIHSSPGLCPTVPLATFPDQDWGGVVGVEPAPWVSMNAGVYQGRPDGGRSIAGTLDNLFGPMILVEPAFHYGVAGRGGHVRLGGWWNGDEVEKLGSGEFDERYGWYLTWDQELWRENPENEEDEQGVGMFAQYGWAPEELSEAEYYLGGGMLWVGPIPGRDEDILGFGSFHVEFSELGGFEDEGETAIEFFYRAQLSRWTSVKSDVQYIRNPGGDGKDDAMAVGVRWDVVF